MRKQKTILCITFRHWICSSKFLNTSLEFCYFWKSLSTGGGKTAPNLEGIVDDPLEAGKGTNHENSGSKTLPETVEADLSVDLLDLSSSWLVGSSLVEDGDHGISWVRNDGAENTSDVTGHEGDTQLSSLTVG